LNNNRGINLFTSSLVNFAVLTFFLAFITGIFYYIYTQIFYNPLHPVYGGGEVFLLPRYFLKQNDLSVQIFSQWSLLFLAILILGFIFLEIYKLSKNKKISFAVYLIAIYVACLVVEFIFNCLASENAAERIGQQALSINNGMYYAIQWLRSTLEGSGIVSLYNFDWLKFLYRDLYAKINPGEYPFVGSTHPPGIFILMMPMGFLTPAGWGVLVGLINTFGVIVFGLIVKRAFGVGIAKLSCIYLIALPSICMHLLAMLDGLPSVLIGVSTLFLIEEMKICNKKLSYKHAVNGFIVGLFFTMAAQFTFGHAIPIISLILTFLIVVRRINYKAESIVLFILSLMIVPILYFIFEFIISDGKLFYIILALERASTVGEGLASRQYPISQLANWIVMSVMGGFIFLPATIISMIYSPKYFQRYLSDGRIRQSCKREDVRNFLIISLFIMTTFLIFQKTVRLEVERTWHWFFMPCWYLIPYLILALAQCIRRLKISSGNAQKKSIIFLVILQLTITITLAISIQDYY